MKSLLKLVDVSLCEKYTTNDNQNGTKLSIQDIKNILKYRFGLDFDKDIERIKSNCRNLRLDDDCFLPKLLGSMAKTVDEKNTYKCFNTESLEIAYNLFFDKSDVYYSNIAYYLLNDIYLILMNINYDEYHHYRDFDKYFVNFDLEFNNKFSSKQSSYDKLNNKGRSNYKDSFMHTLFASSKVVDNERKKSESHEGHDDYYDDYYDDDYDDEEAFEEHTEAIDINFDSEEYNNKRLEYYNHKKFCNSNDHISKQKRNKKQHQWCEATDAVCIATVYTSNFSPFSMNNDNDNDDYKPKALKKLYKYYIHTLNTVISYNKKTIENEYSLQMREYNKRNIFSSIYNCEKCASLYLADMIYGFSMLKEILDVINNADLINNLYNDTKDIINAIFLLCSNLILIPDICNRNMLAKRITERCLKNDTMGENYILIEDAKKFSMYQSKVYYYIMVTYALLTIDYLLKTEKSDVLNDKNVAEEYIRKIIFKGIKNSFTNYHKLPKNQFEKMFFGIDDLSCYFRKPKYNFFTKENFEKYFSTDIFELYSDDNMFLKFYFQLLLNEGK